ncbi:MAG TPA: hypothetical protein VGO40_22570 [Longimicrobium sp.]|jgi:DNA-binding phage protein|nr:hypothetical protein [Longimicrobium sp.]
MVLRTNRPVSHDPRTVHEAVAAALDRELPRVQARLIEAACDTVAAGGSQDEMARLTGLSKRTLARTVAIAGIPTPDRPICWMEHGSATADDSWNGRPFASRQLADEFTRVVSLVRLVASNPSHRLFL